MLLVQVDHLNSLRMWKYMIFLVLILTFDYFLFILAFLQVANRRFLFHRHYQFLVFLDIVFSNFVVDFHSFKHILIKFRINSRKSLSLLVNNRDLTIIYLVVFNVSLDQFIVFWLSHSFLNLLINLINLWRIWYN